MTSDPIDARTGPDAAPTEHGAGPASRRRFPTWIRVGAVVLGVAALFLVFRLFDLRTGLTDTLEWIRSQGVWAPLVFVVLYTLATVFFIPGTILTLGAGVLFGVFMGTVWVSVGSTLGAGLAFLVGRYMMRGSVSRWIEGRSRFEAIDRAVAEEGWKIVGLTRLSPIFPFNLLNYAFGVTRVGFWSYLLASWIGMVPGTLLYVYLGSAAGSLANLGEATERSTAQTVFFYLGRVATLGVTVYVTQVARRALRERIQESSEPPS